MERYSTKLLHKDSENGEEHLEEDEVAFPSANDCGEYVEVHGLALCGRKECRSELPVKCAHMVEHGVVEEFESNEYESGP